MNEILTPGVILGFLLGIVALVVLDVLTRVAVALYRREFEWGKLLLFLQTNVLPYVICYGGFVGLVYLSQAYDLPEAVTTPFAGVAGVIYLFIVGRLVASILGNLREMGLPLEE